MLERQKLVKVIPSRGSMVNGSVRNSCFQGYKVHEIIVKVADNEYVEDFSRILQLHISRITSCIIGINVKNRYKQSPPGSDIDHKPAGFLDCRV